MVEKQKTGYASIDRPWLSYYQPGAERIEPINKTVYQYFVDANKKFMNKVGIEFYKRDITRSEIKKQADDSAKMYKNILGVKPGDQVAMGMLGIPEALYSILGLSKIGAGINLISVTYTPEQIKDTFEQSVFDVFFVLDVFYDLFEDVLKSPVMKDKKIVVVPFTNSFPIGMRTVTLTQRVNNRKKFNKLKEEYGLNLEYYNDLMSKAKKMPEVKEVPYDKDLTFLTVYSSATTGKAKGIQLPIDTFIYMARNHELAELDLNEDTTSLHKVPISFSTGSNNGFILPSLLGMINVLDPVFNKDTIGKSFMNHKRKINVAIISNEMWEGVANSQLKKDTLSELRLPIAGGDGASINKQEKINSKLASYGCPSKTLPGAGSSEVGACAFTSMPGVYKLGTVGIPLPQVNVKICDEAYNELMYNESGEICICSPMMMQGYMNDPEKTKSAFFYVDGDKYYKTGDIGFIDADGFVTYRGRKTKYINVDAGNGNTYKQYLFEIEEKIKEEPAIINCEAVGVSTNGNFKVPVVHIQLADDFNGDVNELLKSLDEIFKKTLPSFSVPVAMKIRDEFPVAKSGKRDTKKLTEEVEGFVSVEDDEVCSVHFENGVKVIDNKALIFKRK